MLHAFFMFATGISASAPIGADIDRYCRAVLASPPARYYSRVRLRGQTGDPAWKRSGKAEIAALPSDPRLVEGAFATVWAYGGATAVARIVRVDGSGDGGIQDDYCFRSGKVVRLRTTVVSVSDEMQWTQTRYYNAAGEPVAISDDAEDLSKHRPGPPPREPAMNPPVYLNVKALPF